MSVIYFLIILCVSWAFFTLIVPRETREGGMTSQVFLCAAGFRRAAHGADLLALHHERQKHRGNLRR